MGLAALAFSADAFAAATTRITVRAALELDWTDPDIVLVPGWYWYGTSSDTDGLPHSGRTSLDDSLRAGEPGRAVFTSSMGGTVRTSPLGIPLGANTHMSHYAAFNISNLGDAPATVRARLIVYELRLEGSVGDDSSELSDAQVLVEWSVVPPLRHLELERRRSTRDPEIGVSFASNFPMTRTWEVVVPPDDPVTPEIEFAGTTVLVWANAITRTGVPRPAAPGGLQPVQPALDLCSQAATRFACRLRTIDLNVLRAIPTSLEPGEDFEICVTVRARRNLRNLRIDDRLPADFLAPQGSALVFPNPLRKGQTATRCYAATAGQESGVFPIDSTVRLRPPGGKALTLRIGSSALVLGEPKPDPEPPAGMPDLIVSFLDEDSVTVVNQGATAAGPFVLSLTGSSPNGTLPLGSFDVGSLGPGGSQSFSFTAPGATMITAVADSGNQVAEASEQNNSRTFQPGPAVPAGLPDLVVSFLDKDSVTVKNIGESDAGPSVLSLTGMSPNDTFPLDSFNVGGLAAGGSQSFSFDCKAGTTITATADSGKQVAEASEQNNTASFQVGSC